jgi:S1-C subfamily serine protease
VHTVSELLARIAALQPGQAVPFALERRSEQTHVPVTPAQRPRPRMQMR